MIRSIQNANDTAFEALQNCRCRSNYKRRNAVTTGVCKIWVVTDEAGMTVYTFDKDRAGKSVCYRGCASTWPPVAAADIPLGPDFGVVTRGDGTGQAG
jgi:predicted lipoprotein with Yx(FWY)xxD motif